MMLAALTCAGCAGSDAQMRLLEKDNVLQVEPSQTKEFDYVVRLKNAVDVGFDPDNPETRKETVLGAMRSQCPGARILCERV
jgi:hypothetical protein